ncbi:isoleucine-tRNA ligase [Puccinia graminis f. sp. tritici]|uniref:isoleucine--tRNA ligase n=2 Tax=Puccinia graminis f. sp. tritici TaxID=56615 RepID=A0A5B0S979_PUCGR|nr:isoleucine-tRNA ligase [Puccinia graminis f. sp. tritici]KAA1134357.1 isoleucine-tRNA ligase [Puccinia graminis f. sp. tritici]
MRRTVLTNHRSLSLVRYRHYGTSPSTPNNKLYSDTLLLPRTDFPLRRLNSEQQGEAQLRLRTTKNLWDWQSNQLQRPVWTLHDGPPYANGSIHMGHALNKILKDIINRNKLLHGFRINYLPGFDCHGLPLELKAIQRLRTACHDTESLEPVQVRDAARATAMEGIELQTQQFDRLSILTDWGKAWRTLDHDYEIKQLELFAQMAKNRLISRHRKPVHFSPSSGTALAEAEIEYRDDHLSRSVYVAFDILNPSPALQAITDRFDFNAKLKAVVWTTTPWTLIANQAVAISKSARYSLVKLSSGDLSNAEVLIFATDRLPALKNLISDESSEMEVVGELSGEELELSTYRHDFNSSDLPIFCANHVTVESGSGLVHTAPSHGLEDFYAYTNFMKTQRPSESLSLIEVVDDQGKFNCQDPIEWSRRLHGKAALEDGNNEVICMLEEQKRLIGKEVKIRHKYPYDWRTKKPILTKITSQWFVELENIRQAALSMIERVDFHPPTSRTRLESFLKSRSEWCISRQRPWGVPIPVLYSVETGLPLLTYESIAWIIDVLRDRGTDHWWQGPVEDFIPPGTPGQFTKGTDVMDVWFDSGVSWLTSDGATADMILEGSDQHRGWFQSQMLTFIAATQPHQRDDPIYKSVVTHGFTLDKHGRKMSKSSGNVLSPLELIDGDETKKQPGFGIDVLRFWTASVDFTRDVTIGVDQLSRLSDVVRKIRSTARFLLGNVYRDDDVKSSEEGLSRGDFGLIEKYMLHLLYEFQQSVQRAYNELDFKQVVQLITNFTTKTLSAFYFETVKDILYSNAQGDPDRQRVLNLMSKVLEIYKLAIAPILPHLAEEIAIHQTSFGRSSSSPSASVFEQCWPSLCEDWKDSKTLKDMEFLISIRDSIMREAEVLRQAKKLRSLEEVELVIDISDPIGKGRAEIVESLVKHDSLLPRLFGLSDASVCRTANVTNTVLNIAAPAWQHPFEFRLGDRQDLIIKLFIVPAWRTKCPRCWKFTVEEGCPVCARCAEVLTSSSSLSPP